MAREPVTNDVKRAYGGLDIEFGREYLVPSIFDNRLLSHIPQAVAKAAISSGAATKEIVDWEAYKIELLKRVSHTYF